MSGGFGNSIWTMGIPQMMKLAGKPCVATLGTGSVEFNGILDQAEITEDTDMGPMNVMQSVLRVDRDVAKQFKGKVKTSVTVGGVSYIMNEPLFEDDGATAVCPIYPVEDDTRYGW